MQSKFSVCLTFDFDALSVWIGSAKTNNPSMISRGEFGAVAVPRILDLLAKFDISSTFFVPGHTALAYPALTRRIEDAGHEIAHHGWVHENPADFDLAGERQIMDRGLKALEDTVGIRPEGYRSPAWDFSTNTVDILNEYGFLYDSSCMGQDFSPYFLRSDDRWASDSPYEFGQETPLVEVPVSWGLDDFPPFEFVPGLMSSMNPPSAVEESWRGDFDWGYANVLGGVMTITMHPQVIGRGARLLMLERLIGHMKACENVMFEPVRAVACRWKANN